MEKPSASGQASPADERLDSWKEIASYLKRSVRGVQRWEAEEGMPVHRHRHDKRGTVYAFKPELDAWCRSKLAGFKKPRRFLFVDSLERNAAGKANYQNLRKLAAERLGS